MESVDCDLCGSDESVPVARQTDRLYATTDEVFTIVRCGGCGLHYTNPRPTAAHIGRFYSDTYAYHGTHSKAHRLATAMAARIANTPLAAVADVVPAFGRRLAAYVQPRIEDPVRAFYASGGNGPFLDIGCGAGASAHFWGEEGALLAYRRSLAVAGIEVAAKAREALDAAGIEAWPDLESVPQERGFGMIRMNWSLEHVHAPSRYFAFIRERLLPGGRAMISVPNYDGLIYRLARECVEVPIHLYHFTPPDLENYASRNGLSVVSLRTFSYPQMFVAAAQAGMLPASLATQPGLRAAHAFQSVMKPFDRANWGNDMIAMMAPAGAR